MWRFCDFRQLCGSHGLPGMAKSWHEPRKTNSILIPDGRLRHEHQRRFLTKLCWTGSGEREAAIALVQTTPSAFKAREMVRHLSKPPLMAESAATTTGLSAAEKFPR